MNGNRAGSGAAIWNSGALILSNSTVASNAAAQNGGALYDTGSTTLTNATLATNSAVAGAGIYKVESGTTTLANTIVADNASSASCVGEITDGGHNLVWPDGTCPGTRADPKLGGLSGYGGPTATIPLLLGSAAINAGSDGVCAALPGAGSLDQRGIPRPQGSHCDIGAYEFELPLNSPPVITSLATTTVPVQLGQSIQVTIEFDDPDTGDVHSVRWDWGDGSVTAAPAAIPTTAGSHMYTSAGVYTLAATITDAAGESASITSQQYVVIYDPDGGYVTGGGWVDSVAGAFSADLTLAGKATFGFVAKYSQGTNVPMGNTEFQFKIASLNFKSISYDWLVIAGSKAQYKGTGTINGAGEYKFMLTAADASPDTFRIRIWQAVTGRVIYDNMLSAPANADPSTAIGGGSIIVHKSK